MSREHARRHADVAQGQLDDAAKRIAAMPADAAAHCNKAHAKLAGAVRELRAAVDADSDIGDLRNNLELARCQLQDAITEHTST